MIKRPSLRVADYADVFDAIKAELLADMEVVAALMPFAPADFEVVGSYARGAAELHSDLDVNVATDSAGAFVAARQAILSNLVQWRLAMVRLKLLWAKWGLKIDLSLEAPTVRTILVKQCYRMRAGTWHHKTFGTVTQRYVLVDGVYVVRRDPPRARPPRLVHGLLDQDGELYTMERADQDPYVAMLPLWAVRYGAKLLRYGRTPETSWVVP